MRKILTFLMIGLIGVSSIFAEELSSEFMEKMTTEELDEWNQIHLKLNLATENKEFDKALLYCENIGNINMASGAIAYADTYRIMGKYKESIEWAQKSVKYAESEKLPIETPLLIMASSYVLMGDNEKSTQTLNKIIELYPDHPMAYKFYAEYYEQTGDTANALKYWQEALKRFTDARAIQQAKERIEALKKSK